MIGKDSKVVLIDSHSFQMNARGTLHLCEVGVPHFTPPELQSMSSFAGFTRTPNHDNSGLALLIFHALFGGRHPYAGVPLKNGVGDALETNIKNFNYAYARDGQSRGIAPPPRSIPLSMLPDGVEAMFHQAFTERGAQAVRPSAQQWVAALDSIRGKLKKCSASAMHVYSNHLTQCPWCGLEKQGVIYFVDLGAVDTPVSTGFVLTQAWAAIQAVPAPPTLNIPSPSSFSITAQPLPSNIPSGGTIVFYKLLAICLGVVVATVVPILGVLLGFVGWFMASSAGSPERSAERSRRDSIRQTTKQAYDQLVERAKRDAGLNNFQVKRAGFAKLRDRYQALPQDEKLELDQLHSTARKRQKQRFLAGCFIDNATISGIGPARKTALRSFGIETAADVARIRVMQAPGFGDSMTRAVTDWKASCERKFVFNAANAVSAADRNAVRAKFLAYRIAIEKVLARGPTELQALHQHAVAQMAMLQPQLEKASKNLA
jgi:DNA-binding helix-hairpin-helix protein with protein kinase domain